MGKRLTELDFRGTYMAYPRTVHSKLLTTYWFQMLW